MNERKLFSLIHGFSKSGKTWLGGTGPGPRLYVDAEGRTEYAPFGPRVLWDPSGPPPDVSPDTTVLVRSKSWNTLGQVYQWIASNNHPFRSKTLDSFQESQIQLILETTGGELRAPSQEEWGIILRKCEAMLRMERDVLRQDGQPLLMSTFLCGSEDLKSRKVPLLQGAIQKGVSHPFDLVGYLFTLDEGPPVMRIAPLEGFECGDGTNVLRTHYGPFITNPNLSDMFRVLNPEESNG